MKLVEVAYKARRKIGNIGFLSFPGRKFSPAQKNIFQRKYLFKWRNAAGFDIIKVMNSIKPPKISMLVSKVLAAYVYWHQIVRHIPKIRRYSVGIVIDKSLAQMLRLVSIIQFSSKERRVSFLSQAIIENDVLKSVLYGLWELQGIEEKHFLELTSRLEEVGRLLYGQRQKILSELPSDKR